ncbi:hypothetical protein chiPu_0003622 [Chiloscyllium punctatum]|uniref:Uncharacterized protein n=1 Tax=Chiloscyllium punctatum TaxID=137246 RepID=A0A401S490_CHIPU|nr:hypothetical protein [Chiloscyllium punctatum]
MFKALHILQSTPRHEEAVFVQWRVVRALQFSIEKGNRIPSKPKGTFHIPDMISRGRAMKQHKNQTESIQDLPR